MAQDTGSLPRSPPNQSLLDEVEQGRAWFRAKKTRPIWAKPVEKDGKVETLEGVTSAIRGDYLCRGSSGERWPQKITTLVTKYRPEEKWDEDGWQLFTPLPDANGVLAAEIQHPFTVHSSWGVLNGRPGDLLVKNWDDRGERYPEDVWIVARTLFLATYEAV